jgi:uncharacterized membrane protein YhaH (DUF805 family)
MKRTVFLQNRTQKLALGARRLHETGRSGWWQLLFFIAFVGIIIVLIMQAQPAKVAS